MMLIQVFFVCALFVSTFADTTDDEPVPAVNLCKEYEDAMIPKEAKKEGTITVANANKVFNGLLKTVNPGGHLTVKAEKQRNIPRTITNNLTLLRVTSAPVRVIDFSEYKVNQNSKILQIRVHFELTRNHEIVVQVPVLGVNEDDKVDKNDKLDRYLREMKVDTKQTTKHVLDWINYALKPPVKFIRTTFAPDFKVDTYYASCQYMSTDLIREFAQRFGWNQ